MIITWCTKHIMHVIIFLNRIIFLSSSYPLMIIVKYYRQY